MKLARNGDGPEIFESLQGEGVSVGIPSVFVRLSLCNLHCTWCDTAYTWNWTGTAYPHDNDAPGHPYKFRREDEIVELSLDEITQRVLNYRARNIIFTGGEPLIQGRDLALLASNLRIQATECRFEVETNGTLCPPPELDALVDQYNVSPKLSNSGNTSAEREKAHALRFFAHCERAWFKFVAASPDDLADIQYLQDTYAVPASRIILMPQGTTPEDLHMRAHWLSTLCLEQGYRFGDRLHVHLYGQKRGV